MSAVIGLTEEEGAESFLAALETGLTSEEQKKDKTMRTSKIMKTGVRKESFLNSFICAPRVFNIFSHPFLNYC